MTITFVGYIAYNPSHGFWKAQFEVNGHAFFPDGAVLDFDTLKKLKMPIPKFPDFFKWRQDLFQRQLNIAKMLHEIPRRES